MSGAKQDLTVENDRAAALQALSLVEGILGENPAAESLLVDAFDSVEDAARAHAYLAGFLLEMLSNERRADEAATAGYVRDFLTQR